MPFKKLQDSMYLCRIKMLFAFLQTVSENGPRIDLIHRRHVGGALMWTVDGNLKGLKSLSCEVKVKRCVAAAVSDVWRESAD